MLFPFYKSLLIYRRDDREVFIALQYRGRGAWGAVGKIINKRYGTRAWWG